MKMENNECFDESSVFVVKLPVSEHKRPAVVEAKRKELENIRYENNRK